MSDNDPMTDSNFDYGTFILLFPFFAIPSGIILARIVKYIWKIYQARKYGFGDDILEDPLAELGLKVRRGFDNTAEIRKLRKEKNRIKKEAFDERAKDIKRLKESEKINGFGRRFSSKLNDFVPIHAAGEYFKSIRRQTTKTWYEKLSPSAIRRWVNVSRYARLWMVLQITCTLLAIINYVALTYLALRDDRDERILIKNLDIFYACFFLLDYVLSFYIAEDRLLYFAQPMSLVDLMSIVSPFVYLFVASPTKYVWFIGFVRIFRATRIMRTYRLLAFAQSEETRELTVFTLNFINFIFFSASVINATEALEFAAEAPSLKNWHDSLYYILVTFSTIGFGDLTPSSSLSRVVVMFLIVLVVLYVPWQTGKILELFNSLSRYQRARYSVRHGGSHVVLAGDLTYNTIVDFCREFFMADDIASVVILSNHSPSIDVRRLLNHPFYRSRILYVQGAMLSHTDLKRVQADYATGLFILANEETSNEEDEMKVYEKDSKILLQALYAKTSFPGLPIFTQLNDYSSKDLAAHCGIDRVVALDEIKATLFAGNCACPGMITLILNLIHSYKDVDPGPLREFWTAEYECGLVSQIQAMKIPLGLVGAKYGEAIKEVYGAFNVVIFALVSNNTGFNQNKIRFIIEKDYRLKVDDIAFFIGDGGDEQTMRIGLHFREQSEKETDLDIEMDKVASSSNSHLITPVPIIFSPNAQNLDPTSDFSPFGFESLPDDISDHIIVAGHISPRVILHFVKGLRERKNYSQGFNAARNHTSIVLILDNPPDENNLSPAWREIFSFKSIFTLKGRAVQKSVLDKARITSCKQIVVFSNHGAELGTSDAQAVFLVKLIRKEWPNVKFLVELIEGANVKYFSPQKMEWDTNNLRMQSIMNNYSLAIGDRQSFYRTLRTEGAEKNSMIFQLLQFITGKGTSNEQPVKVPTFKKRDPIQKTSSTGDYDSLLTPLHDDNDRENVKKEVPITEVYLQRAIDEAELNESGLAPYPIYHFDKHFAAGMVASTSFMQTLLCQSYFRPFIIDVVRGLISNSCTLPVKASIAGKQYIFVLDLCLNEGYIPLGLFRNGASKSIDKLPYVYTNCRQGDIVNAEDLIFVLKSQ